MNGKAFFFVEFLIMFGAFLAWACWDLWSLRRSQARDREAAAERALRADVEPHTDER